MSCLTNKMTSDVNIIYILGYLDLGILSEEDNEYEHKKDKQNIIKGYHICPYGEIGRHI